MFADGKQRNARAALCRGTVWTGTLILLAALATPTNTSAQAEASTEYQRKSAFLAQFPNFVSWPMDAPQIARAPVKICVYGDFEFGTSLAEAARGSGSHGKKLEVRWVRKLPEVRDCQILFVSRSEHARYAQVLAAITYSGVLTVGETAGFLDAGGAISFSYDRELLQFEVNLAAARSARLKMSAQLLSLARRVMNPGEGAKG